MENPYAVLQIIYEIVVQDEPRYKNERYLQTLYTVLNDGVPGIHNNGDTIHDYFAGLIKAETSAVEKIGAVRTIPAVRAQLDWAKTLQ